MPQPPLPPTVGERLARCGTHVEVWGIVPGADVTLDIEGAQQTQTVSGTGTTFTVSPLPANARIRARQRVGADDSNWGNVVTVDDVLLPPAPPNTEHAIARCAGCIGAWGGVPGSRVEIREGGSPIATGEANRMGWACMATTSKPATPMDAVAIVCGAPSSPQGIISIFDPPAPLPPPIIVEPVFECQTRVAMTGLVPGATVEVLVTDASNTTSPLGTFCACAGSVLAGVGRAMRPGDRVKAVQRMVNPRWDCEIGGTESGDTPVVPPDARLKPVIVSPLWEGDGVLYVTNQVEGGSITLLLRKTAADPEEDLGSRPSSQYPEVPVPEPPLVAGQVWRVRQTLCGVEEYSDPVTVQGLPPTIDRPRVRPPLYGCGDVVAVDGVLPGAIVHVRQTPPNALAPEYPIGKKKATGSSVVVDVFPLLQADASVTAYQEVGGKLVGPAKWVPVGRKTEFGPPTIVPPAIVGQTFVWLQDVIPGAHIRIVASGTPIGGGSMPDIAGRLDLWAPIPEHAILAATQALCAFETRPSFRPAVSNVACDGPPAYDPAKWNDGAQIQGCNNCYNYACDIRTDNFAQPGGSGATDCGTVRTGALADGLRACTTSECHPCHHRVALVVAPGHDYHWYRQDINGLWSHKRGCQAAKNVDESKNPITDPATADRGPYTDFCGYFCVYKPDVNISGPGCKCWP